MAGDVAGRDGSIVDALIEPFASSDSAKASATARAASAATMGSVAEAVIRRMPVPLRTDVSISAPSGRPSASAARSRIAEDFAVWAYVPIRVLRSFDESKPPVAAVLGVIASTAEDS